MLKMVVFNSFRYVEMSCLDYDDVIDLSSGWAESLKCVKEFVHLAVDITKTDMYCYFI